MPVNDLHGVPAALPDDVFVSLLGRIGAAFALAVVAVTGIAWVLVPHPRVGTTGLALGAALALAAWVASRAVMSWRFGRTPPAPDAAAAQAVVRTTFFMALALTESPALLGFVAAQALTPDVGAVTVAGPVAAAAIWLNLAGPAAVRRLLERAQER